MMKLLFIGAGAGGEMMASIYKKDQPSHTIDFLDDNPSLWNKNLRHGNVLGVGLVAAPDLLESYDFAFIGIALHRLMGLRLELMEKLLGKIPLVNIIHPTAYISPDAHIGEGNYLGAFSYVGPFAAIGNCNFFSAQTCIEHHSTVKDLNSWGPANAISGKCCIGSRVRFGTGISAIDSLVIGDEVIVGSGVILDKNIAAKSVVRLKELSNYAIVGKRHTGSHIKGASGCP
jgi:acetyltransferase-like isoleucine patch superfamily enzyme